MKNYLINVVYGYYFARLLYMINPKWAVNMMYRRAFHRNVNWENPKNLIEKYYWLLYNTDTSLWTKCADKYKVREFIEEKGCSEILVELYGAWTDVDEIDFDKLPNQFVLKSNNGCGTVLVVKDKTTLNIKKTKKMLKRWLKYPFGYNGGQKHYFSIPPCIIAEELLTQDKTLNKISPSSLVDYKVWCINGDPEAILMTFDRTKVSLKLKLYSPEWKDISHHIVYGGHYPNFNDIQIPKPECLESMLEIAKKLSAGFPEVRVDFYIVDNTPKFGELTFSTGFGYFTEEYYNYLGSKIDLDSYR